MDALPHLENTNLEYASTKIVKGSDGKKHRRCTRAGGHDLSGHSSSAFFLPPDESHLTRTFPKTSMKDTCWLILQMHTAVLLADEKMLLDAKSEWSGTLVVLFRPAEELAVGARAMVEDGLYDASKFAVPKPDIVLGQHTHAFKAGMIALGGGAILTAVDSFDVQIFGKSGHICRAELFVDAVVTAIHIVVRYKVLSQKKCDQKNLRTANIIPDFVDLKISIRSYNPSIHERLVEAVKRVVYSECEISGSLAIGEPIFTTTMQAPPTVNDFLEAEILKKSFGEYFGRNLIPADHFGASEDISYLALGCDAPYVFYNFGCVDEDTWEEAKFKGTMEDIPHNHSAFFAPKI
ncbi:hypothetical protein BELL_0593g00030 [Botrytis elliptica]|uniref:Peptidase M20 dimerisation domain-containing protein n=1 Tax=Botrytis elliptica TaxID=278938 RepID=A0A4Z1JCA2_9HELO|nr:hypothetical protein BELL_0593g00030 [Botrytis elliptica]